MYSYFVCVLLLVRDSELATHPYSSDMDTHQLTANSSIAALFLADMSSNKFAFVGERASGHFYWSSPLAAKQSLKSSRVCKFQEVQLLSQSQKKCWKSDYHLALLTMLSALRHGWGILALVFVIVKAAKGKDKAWICFMCVTSCSIVSYRYSVLVSNLVRLYECGLADCLNFHTQS